MRRTFSGSLGVVEPPPCYPKVLSLGITAVVLAFYVPPHRAAKAHKVEPSCE